MKNSDLEDLKIQVQKFCEDRDWDPFHGPKDLAIGLITEAAELLEHFRFQSEKESLELLKEPKERSQVESELADCFFFILRFSQRFDVDLKAALLKKIDENGKKYPVDLSRGSNKKYNKLSKDL
ncbi:MAG TPA: nucleotide pyrophosphohydrolase [Bdellovibrionales bacterium]|nr:nucleotide pyrophosphohydrolase [Pseudobdellovibrionaceae bacterium]HAG92362.1 nucleotide pyrophosphohydrolase [Bdellovibrionales bacterium]|tara:strand:+ start:1323 stop:1694 length:372 start_codon:yes stop_codon:yes gene_type:complete